MKKNLTAIFTALFIVLQMVIAGPVYAEGSAFFSFEDQNLTGTVGERFSVDVYAQPNGEDLDTVRFEMRFSPESLEIESFQLGELFSRATPGNSIDNQTGFLSQGGFTLEGPVNNEGVFGTITFIAKAEGQTSLEILDSSKMISAGEEKINVDRLEDITVTMQKAEEEKEKPKGQLTITSDTHIDEDAWYNTNTINLSWTTTDQNIARYYRAFDEDPTTEPKILVEGGATKTIIENGEDGIWFFHLKGQRNDGSFTETIHYKIQIDTVAPNAIVPVLSQRQVNENAEVTVEFGTTDDGSGILGYEMSINDGPFIPRGSPVTLSDLIPGDYLIKVKALDKAGNTIYGLDSFRVYPEELWPGDEQENALQDEKKEGKNVGLLIIILLGIGVIFAIMKNVIGKKQKTST